MSTSQFKHLPGATREKIRDYHYDYSVGRRNGRMFWSMFLDHYEPVLLAAGENVIVLPHPSDESNSITVERLVISEDGNIITVFLHDNDVCEEHPHLVGKLAVCIRIPGEALHVAILYHSTGILDGITVHLDDSARKQDGHLE